MRTRTVLGTLNILLLIAPPAWADETPAAPEKGTVAFRGRGDQSAIPERYRLEAHSFDFQLTLKAEMAGIGADVYRLQFPSPVVTKCPQNNTVHAEYYRPRGKGPFPCVIVLDITGGDQMISRTIATQLVQNHIAGLFVQMAYYGPRRPAGSSLRLLTPDYHHTMDAIRQTVLDLRRAAAWMESRPEIDARRLGILGTSLGSFIGALTAEMEPRLSRVAVLLGGGGLVDAYYDDPRGANFRKVWEALGGTREKMRQMIAPADPITCAANLQNRDVLILSASRDEIVPPKATEALWKASGQQKIVWYDCTHYGAVMYIVPALRLVVQHFGAE